MSFSAGHGHRDRLLKWSGASVDARAVTKRATAPEYIGDLRIGKFSKELLLGQEEGGSPKKGTQQRNTAANEPVANRRQPRSQRNANRQGKNPSADVLQQLGLGVLDFDKAMRIEDIDNIIDQLLGCDPREEIEESVQLAPGHQATGNERGQSDSPVAGIPIQPANGGKSETTAAKKGSTPSDAVAATAREPLAPSSLKPGQIQNALQPDTATNALRDNGVLRKRLQACTTAKDVASVLRELKAQLRTQGGAFDWYTVVASLRRAVQLQDDSSTPRRAAHPVVLELLPSLIALFKGQQVERGEAKVLAYLLWAIRRPQAAQRMRSTYGTAGIEEKPQRAEVLDRKGVLGYSSDPQLVADDGMEEQGGAQGPHYRLRSTSQGSPWSHIVAEAYEASRKVSVRPKAKQPRDASPVNDQLVGFSRSTPKQVSIETKDGSGPLPVKGDPWVGLLGSRIGVESVDPLAVQLRKQDHSASRTSAQDKPASMPNQPQKKIGRGRGATSIDGSRRGVAEATLRRTRGQCNLKRRQSAGMSGTGPVTGPYANAWARLVGIAGSSSPSTGSQQTAGGRLAEAQQLAGTAVGQSSIHGPDHSTEKSGIDEGPKGPTTRSTRPKDGDPARMQQVFQAYQGKDSIQSGKKGRQSGENEIVGQVEQVVASRLGTSRRAETALRASLKQSRAQSTVSAGGADPPVAIAGEALQQVPPVAAQLKRYLLGCASLADVTRLIERMQASTGRSLVTPTGPIAVAYLSRTVELLDAAGTSATTAKRVVHALLPSLMTLCDSNKLKPDKAQEIRELLQRLGPPVGFNGRLAGCQRVADILDLLQERGATVDQLDFVTYVRILQRAADVASVGRTRQQDRQKVLQMFAVLRKRLEELSGRMLSSQCAAREVSLASRAYQICQQLQVGKGKFQQRLEAVVRKGAVLSTDSAQAHTQLSQSFPQVVPSGAEASTTIKSQRQQAVGHDSADLYHRVMSKLDYASSR